MALCCVVETFPSSVRPGFTNSILILKNINTIKECEWWFHTLTNWPHVGQDTDRPSPKLAIMVFEEAHSSSFAQKTQMLVLPYLIFPPTSEGTIFWRPWAWRLKHFYLNYCLCLSVYLSGVGWSRHASSTSLCIMSSACMRSICLTLLRSRMSATATPRPRHTTVHCTAFGGMHHCS